ncbi:MAG: hypothetical protein M5U14_12170 [Acidimicrobiia bacterium]|nr:hypothetical protein [Acidimicrobiia bacterium]
MTGTGGGGAPPGAGRGGGAIDALRYLLLGLGGGAVVAALALGLVLTHRASGVINFAHGATGMYVAFVYFELRRSGDLVLPLLGLPARVHLVDRPTELTALTASMLVAAAVGVLVYGLVFRPLRRAAPSPRSWRRWASCCTCRPSCSCASARAAPCWPSSRSCPATGSRS